MYFFLYSVGRKIKSIRESNPTYSFEDYRKEEHFKKAMCEAEDLARRKGLIDNTMSDSIANAAHTYSDDLKKVSTVVAMDGSIPLSVARCETVL